MKNSANKNLRKVLSIIICLALVMSYVPMVSLTAFAADGDTTVDSSLASYYGINKEGFGGKDTIIVDGNLSDWDSSMLIAQGTANDDPRVYRPNSMFEVPIDLYALYASYDDSNLYLMWEMTNVQDVVAPSDDYPLSQGVLFQTMNVPFYIAIDTGDEETAIGNNAQLIDGGTIKNSGITISESFNKLIEISTNGTSGPFVYGGNSSGLNPEAEISLAQTGIRFNYNCGILSEHVYGIDEGYGEYNNRVVGDMCDENAAWVDFNTLGHSSSTMDFFYEMSIPLDVLGVTADDVAENGLGVMLIATIGKSAMDCLPYDLSMNDNADKEDAAESSEQNSFEKSDEDYITTAFARVAVCCHNFVDGTCKVCGGTCETLGHIIKNGICIGCGECQPATETKDKYDINGDGTKDTVYEISNAGQLYWFARYVNASNRYANAILTADITVNEKVLENGALVSDTSALRTWTPISFVGGTNSRSYYGIFDGKGHTVSGLYQTSTSDYYGGLFGSNYGTIKNVTVKDSYFSVAQRVGAIAGWNSGTIENCANEGSAVIATEGRAGGITGISSDYSIIFKCYNTGEVKGGSERTGGIAGAAQVNTFIQNCYNTGNVIGTSYVGGVVGLVTNPSDASISNCYNAGNVSGTSYVGGIIGSMSNNSANTSKISDCYYNTDVFSGTAINNSGNRGTVTNVVGKTTEQFRSGEVAYLLQSGNTEQVWGQNIGTDDYPDFTGDTVYLVGSCAPEYATGYTNDQIELEHAGYDRNGLCALCHKDYQPAVDSNGDDCYEISNAGNLYWFAEFVNGGNKSANAILTADIDLEGYKWTTICPTDLYYDTTTYADTGYAGTFDGNGHIIKNVSLKGASKQKKSVGLFGTLSGTVKNLGIETLTFDLYGATDIRAGAIVGQIIGGTVSDCYVKGATINPGTYVAGGIAGCNYAGTIENGYVVQSTVSGSANRFGYIVGDNHGDISNTDRVGTIKNCYTDASIIVGNKTGTVNNSEAGVSAERFASGEVAYLLQQGNTEQVWGQDSNQEGATPILDSTGLYKVVTVGETGNYSVANVGDTNADGTVDVEDYQALVNKALADDHEQIETASYDDIVRYDLDGDGYLDVLDASLMHLLINGFKTVDVYAVGDYDINGVAFEEADIKAIKHAIGNPEKLATYKKYASDINGDGKVSEADLTELTGKYGEITGTECADNVKVYYRWGNNYSTCTATAMCTLCGETYATETVKTTSETLAELTCTQDGETKYTATFTNELFEEHVKNVTEKARHDYENGICTTCGAKVIEVTGVTTDIENPWGNGWNNDERLNATSMIGVDDCGKIAWEKGDVITVTFTSEDFGAQTGTLIYDGSTWDLDGKLQYLDGEYPTITAVYGTSDGKSEYLTGNVMLSDDGKTITIIFDSRNYSRLRIAGEEGKTYTVTFTNFTSAGESESKTATFNDLTPDGNGNMYLYGTWSAGSTVTVKSGETTVAEYTFTEASVRGQSYALNAKVIVVDASKVSVTVGGTYTYNGSTQTPAPANVTVTYDGKQLEYGTDYTYEATNNVNAGTATVTVTFKGLYVGTATGTFTIHKASPTYTAPTTKLLVYYNNPLPLVNAGAASGGTMQYSLDNINWSTSVPTAVNAGTYTVYYKVVGDANHTDSAVNSISSEISKATPPYTVPTGLTAKTGNTLANVALPTGFSWESATSTSVGNVGTNYFTVKFTPQDTANYNVVTGIRVSITVVKPAATVTKAPTVISGLVYSGSAQTLANAGTASGGTMQYSLDNISWSTRVPTATNTGTYTVYYKAVGDANHSDSATNSFKVSIRAEGVKFAVGDRVQIGAMIGKVTYCTKCNALINNAPGTVDSFRGTNSIGDGVWFVIMDCCGYRYPGAVDSAMSILN